MRHVDAIVIGAGQAGLAISKCLTDRGVGHVVLERGRIGERWRSERWESLRLLTPRWQSRLPGWSYAGDDPDGYMSRDELVGYLEGYARSFRAPVQTGVTVEAVRPLPPHGFEVLTDRGRWSAGSVVVATGECDRPWVPPLAERLAPEVAQVVPTEYRSPRGLATGGVLVVGSAATGLQLADEIHRSGRPVTLSVGRHSRLPRTYRGRDILAWLDALGVLDHPAAEVPDLEAACAQPSFGLVGTPDRRDLDLGVLAADGVRLVGSARAADSRRVTFEDDLVENMVAADAKLARLRARIDAYIEATYPAGVVPPALPFVPLAVPDGPAEIDLGAEDIRTVVWATGYRRAYPWLHVPVLDHDGDIAHRGGVTRVAGVYALGLRFMRRRNSSFLDGVGHDAEAIAELVDERRHRLGAGRARGA